MLCILLGYCLKHNFVKISARVRVCANKKITILKRLYLLLILYYNNNYYSVMVRAGFLIFTHTHAHTFNEGGN